VIGGAFGSPIYFSYIHDMEQTKTIEKDILIARRVPPGDKWRLIANEPSGPVHKTLTDTLEAYMTKTGFKGEYKLSPLAGKLFAIDAEEVIIEKPKEQKFSIYGEY
tara:strand:+ start:430 stop:747 length:318 start_codon:yes stop_codon:yes gene_type:complete